VISRRPRVLDVEERRGCGILAVYDYAEQKLPKVLTDGESADPTVVAAAQSATVGDWSRTWYRGLGVVLSTPCSGNECRLVMSAIFTCSSLQFWLSLDCLEFIQVKVSGNFYKMGF
jgi:hypothetical protein